MSTFSVGDIECTVIGDGGFYYPPETFEGVRETDLVELGRRPDDGAVFLPYNALMVRTNGSTVLIDTGMGEMAATLEAPAGELAHSLSDAGVDQQEVDVVIITHGHPDHIGGLTNPADGSRAVTFTNARHVLSRTEWEFWTGDEQAGLPPHLADLMVGAARTHLPVLDAAGQLELVDRETEIAPGVWVTPAPGHTPGHVAVLLASAGAAALFVADALFSEFQVSTPDWVPPLDVAGDTAVQTRRRLLDRAASDGSLVSAYHMPSRGYVERGAAAYRFVPARDT